MKKITLALAVSGALGVSSAAQAITVSEFSAAVLVPHALWVSGETSTAIGLTAACAGTVFWTFFDEDTKHIIDGFFDMSEYDWVHFQHADTIGDVKGRFNNGPQFPGIDGQRGYYLFVHDIVIDDDRLIGRSDAPCLAGNAWQINGNSDDVIYIPTLPVHADELDDGTRIENFDADTLFSLRAGASANNGDILFLNYADDAAVSDIVIWSAQDVSGSYTVFVYDTDENRASTNLDLPNKELNVIDSRTITKPIGHVVGFIEFDLSHVADPDEDGVFSFSLIRPAAADATQTVINPIWRRP